MRFITATAARKRLGALLDAVQKEPVTIRRKNLSVCVIVSAEEYARICGLDDRNREAVIRPKK